MKKNSKKGFTLVELLIVIGIIGFLAAAILVAVDPVKRLQDARNAKRWSEVNAVLNAILNKQVDDKAYYTGSTAFPIVPHATLGQMIVNDPTDIAALGNCTVPASAPTCAEQALNTSAAARCWVNLKDLVPTYIADIPLDPAGGIALNTGYYLQQKTAGGRITIGSCTSEQSAHVKVMR